MSAKYTYSLMIVTADPVKVAAVLGKDAYDTWQYNFDRARQQLGDFEKYQERTPPAYFEVMTDDIQSDANAVDKTTWALGEGMRNITQGQPVDAVQLQNALSVQSLALDAMEQENDALEATLDAGLIGGYLLFTFNNVQNLANAAQPKLEQLQEALKQARKNVSESKVQAAIDVGLDVVGVFIPEGWVLSKVGLAAASWATDTVLGGRKSNAGVDALSTVQSGANSALPIFEKWTWFSKDSASAAGKGFIVAGLYFDSNEYMTAVKDEQALVAASAAAVYALNGLLDLLDRMAPGMMSWRGQVRAVARSVAASKAYAAQLRAEWRTEAMQAHFYLY